jgi:hypothetical protein
MAADPPVNFENLAKQGGNPAAGGYPYQIKASDLQKNFVFATDEFDPAHFDEASSSGQGGHPRRRIKLKNTFPDPPSRGTHVLGAVDGAIQWIATEEC